MLLKEYADFLFNHGLHKDALKQSEKIMKLMPNKKELLLLHSKILKANGLEKEAEVYRKKVEAIITVE